ncbi:MAG TPA: VOC family protein [Stellaceae bacterium]|nr:VOC family protein [Stellaceae bacterium]
MTAKKERITVVTAEEARRLPDMTDYARLDAMTDEDIARAVAEDPDAVPVDADWSDAVVVIPPRLRDRVLLVDDEVGDWFAATGEDGRDRMQAVLRAYMERHRSPEGRGARINHIALKVTDLETATKFYENVYGFRQVRTGRSRGHISRHMTDGTIDLALMIYDSEDDAEAKLVGPGPAIHHFGIEVDDHEAFAAKVAANGGNILSRPGEVPIKYRSPDGVVAEVVPMGRYEKMKAAE